MSASTLVTAGTNSTRASPVAKFTAAFFTPCVRESTFSTRAAHAAHVMPVIGSVAAVVASASRRCSVVMLMDVFIIFLPPIHGRDAHATLARVLVHQLHQ